MMYSGRKGSMQQPRKTLKFENVLTVVPLLFLACTRIASLANYSSSKVAKIVVRHKIVSVWAEGSQQSSVPEKPKAKFISVSGNTPEVSSLSCEAAGSTR